MANRREHPTHLAIPTLPKRDPRAGLVTTPRCSPAVQPHICRFAPATINHDTRTKLPERSSVGDSAYDGFVHPLDTIPGMSQSRRQISIVRQQEHTLRVVVESTNRIHIFAHAGHQIEDRPPVLRIETGRHEPNRLVEKKVPTALCAPDTTPVNTDIVSIGVGSTPELRDDLTVHRHTAGLDHAFGGTPRGDPRPGQDLLETDCVAGRG